MKKGEYCTNCGKDGHIMKKCEEPITSYGIIAVHINTNFNISSIDVPINLIDGIKYSTEEDIYRFNLLNNAINFLMIQRKHTIGYIEFIRGKYNIDNIDGIIFLFRQMITDEKNKIRELTFDELWNDLWKENSNKPIFKKEYMISKSKFEKLKYNTYGNTNINLLDFCTKNTVPLCPILEWGFPKGRRNYKETDMECALREFCEETGIVKEDVKILMNVSPLNEEFMGTNGIVYRHIYYIAIVTSLKDLKIDEDKSEQANEIGDIQWFNYISCNDHIIERYDTRKKILTKLFYHLVNNLN